MTESAADQSNATGGQCSAGSRSQVEPNVASAASPNLVLAIVSVGMILANLDLFVVNVALPNIALDFGNPGGRNTR
jgi:hypothetical protein